MRNTRWKILLAAAISLVTLSGGIESAHAETQHYDDGSIVRNLTSIQNGTVDMVAQWADTSIILPSPSKPGYDFVAWYKDKDCTKFVGNAGDTYTPKSQDETLYAKWTPKKFTVSFDTNLDHTETSKYALSLPTGNTSDIEVSFDTPYAKLPVLVLDGYEFMGWYEEPTGDKKITNSDKYTHMDETNSDGADQVVYAHWKNLNPTNVKLHASNGTDSYTVSDTEVTTGWSNTPYTLYATAKDPGDGIASATLGRNDIYSIDIVKKLTYNKVTELTESNASFGTYTKEGTTSLELTVTDTEGAKSGRIESGSTTTAKLNLKVDTKAPVVSTFTVELGTHQNPNNTNTTLEWNGWKVYDAEAYGAKVSISVSDKNASAAGGESDVSKIKHAWLTVYDTDNHENTLDYELVADNSEELSFTYNNILDTNNDFNGVMNLTYELHVVDNAGNETVTVRTTERKPEVLSTVVKLTNDTTGDPLLFKAGYRGQILIYTTGWVDTIALEWPECIAKSGDYDMDHGELGMIYNATMITNGMSADSPISMFAKPAAAGLTAEEQLRQAILATEYTDYNNPSSKTITLDVDGEDTGFTRCYVFDFWVPVYIGYEDNPYHIDMNTINQINTKIIASKYIINTEAEAVTTETVSAMGAFDIRVGNGSIMEEFRSSIIQ